MTAERVWAFSNGTEYLDWESNNCCRCRKTYDPTTGASPCDLNDAIFMAGIDDGLVAPEIAGRLGWVGDGGQHGRCPEMEPGSMNVTDDQALVRQVNDQRKESDTPMTQLARTEPSAIETEDVFQLGRVLFESHYFQDVQSAAQAVVKILRGRELGIGPIEAMENIHVIKGKTGLSSGIIAARIKRSGRYDYQVAQLDDSGCQLVFSERGTEIGRSIFDESNARAAGLLDGNYKKFPRNMYFARALTNGARWYCPDVFGGPVYTPEELHAIPEPMEPAEPFRRLTAVQPDDDEMPPEDMAETTVADDNDAWDFGRCYETWEHSSIPNLPKPLANQKPTYYAGWHRMFTLKSNADTPV